ncbi:MAG TPA: hypothetical protein VMP01_11075 [Pirellulaceae bacterium]|nr:hypothetical protein [Pirellulaceae bacterium]
MDWLASTLASLAAQPVIGYAPAQSPATEPTALAALALIAAGKARQAAPALDFLASCQGSDGAVGIRHSEPSPGWPTGLAVLAWRAADDASSRNAYAAHRRRAVDWILEAKGTAMPRSPEMGHDTQLVAWSWADKTHSWIEPTALNVLALKRAGLGTHARVREAIRLLVDRLLPVGGCNYGNTVVLGQTLRPHVQPTGLAMLALAGEVGPACRAGPDQVSDRAARSRPAAGTYLERSLAYLQRSLIRPSTAMSGAWALLGLRAHGIELANGAELLAAAHRRVQAHDRSPHKLALLALAAQNNSLALLVSDRGRAG